MRRVPVGTGVLPARLAHQHSLGARRAAVVELEGAKHGARHHEGRVHGPQRRKLDGDGVEGFFVAKLSVFVEVAHLKAPHDVVVVLVATQELHSRVRDAGSLLHGVLLEAVEVGHLVEAVGGQRRPRSPRERQSVLCRRQAGLADAEGSGAKRLGMQLARLFDGVLGVATRSTARVVSGAPAVRDGRIGIGDGICVAPVATLAPEVLTAREALRVFLATACATGALGDGSVVHDGLQRLFVVGLAAGVGVAAVVGATGRVLDVVHLLHVTVVERALVVQGLLALGREGVEAEHDDPAHGDASLAAPHRNGVHAGALVLVLGHVHVLIGHRAHGVVDAKVELHRGDGISGARVKRQLLAIVGDERRASRHDPDRLELHGLHQRSAGSLGRKRFIALLLRVPAGDLDFVRQHGDQRQRRVLHVSWKRDRVVGLLVGHQEGRDIAVVFVLSQSNALPFVRQDEAVSIVEPEADLPRDDAAHVSFGVHRDALVFRTADHAALLNRKVQCARRYSQRRGLCQTPFKLVATGNDDVDIADSEGERNGEVRFPGRGSDAIALLHDLRANARQLGAFQLALCVLAKLFGGRHCGSREARDVVPRAHELVLLQQAPRADKAIVPFERVSDLDFCEGPCLQFLEVLKLVAARLRKVTRRSCKHLEATVNASSQVLRLEGLHKCPPAAELLDGKAALVIILSGDQLDHQNARLVLQARQEIHGFIEVEGANVVLV
eukprot:scaffold1661_cov251-Pinguiococcus_pyrenoidosus.AAC.6